MRQVRQVVAHPPEAHETLFGPEDAPTTVAQVVEALLVAEDTFVNR
jgi:hypothetical protein